MPVCRTLTNTSLMPISGSSTSSSHRPRSALLLTSAFITYLLFRVGSLVHCDARPRRVRPLLNERYIQVSLGGASPAMSPALKHLVHMSFSVIDSSPFVAPYNPEGHFSGRCLWQQRNDRNVEA